MKRRKRFEVNEMPNEVRQYIDKEFDRVYYYGCKEYKVGSSSECAIDDELLQEDEKTPLDAWLIDNFKVKQYQTVLIDFG